MDKKVTNMAKLQELHLQIDQGKTAVLFFKEEDEDVQASINKNKQGLYTSTFSYLNRPNPFPQPQTHPHSSWSDLLADINETMVESDHWDIK
jgi:hypothetical protein